MAVKKKDTAKAEAKTEEIKVEESVVVEEPKVDKKSEPEVTVEPEISVDVEGSTVKSEEQPEKNVRIKVGADHKCNIGGEWYNLKKGQCYNVPSSVKEILKQVDGLLLPL